MTIYKPDFNKKPRTLPSQYKGIIFRSKLEAKWAYYFDLSGVGWVYEPEGFDLGLGDYYCPDFKLIEKRFWVEIKPFKDRAIRDDGVDDSFRRLVKLVNQTNIPGLHLAGDIPFIKANLDYRKINTFIHWYCINPGYNINNGLSDHNIIFCLPEFEIYHNKFNFLFNANFLTRARRAKFHNDKAIDEIMGDDNGDGEN